ncbi:carotenoid biosynthesis protein [Ferroplasma sp.]|uniref:carotenoid biosynthesis protein n=1 Tax=Ferroplasma sp. TaxID=2591003 RepID=UPI00307E7EED
MKTEWVIAYSYLIFGSAMLVAYLFTHNYELSVAAELIFIPFYFYHSIKFKGFKYTEKFFSVSYILAFIIEFIGLHTGFPFGRYTYTAILGPELFGVPVAIPFLWSSLLYFSSIAARERLFTSSLLMLFLDMSFDPRFSRHLWHWAVPGIYFGVPLSNFFGWFGASLLIFAVLLLFTEKNSSFSINGLIFYTLLGYFQCVEDVVVGIYIPAVISSIIFTLTFLFLLNMNYKNSVEQQHSFIGRIKKTIFKMEKSAK